MSTEDYRITQQPYQTLDNELRALMATVTRRARLFLCMAVSLLACGCSDSMKEFTQCVRPLSTPMEFVRNYYRDEKRECYGNRWRMPRAYFGHKYVAYHPIAEDFIIDIEEAHEPEGTLPNIPTGIVRVGPLFSDSRRVLSHGIAAYHTGKDYISRPDQFGMKVEVVLQAGEVSDALFIREQPPFLYVLCRPVPKKDGHRRLEQSVCDVNTVFEELAFVEFSVRYHQIEHLESVTKQVFALLNEYLVR